MENVGKSKKLVGGKRFKDERDTERRPMLNTVILGIFFQVIPFVNFKNYRQVCRAWWQMSLKRWRQEARYRIAYNSQSSSRRHNAPKTIHISELLARMQNPDDPYQFHMHCIQHVIFDTVTISKLNTERLLFWTSVGPSIESLEMRHVKATSATSFRRIIFELTPNMKKLIVVTWPRLNRCRDYDIKNEMDAGNQMALKTLEIYKNTVGMHRCVTWKEVLLRYPNLKNLKLENFRLDLAEWELGKLFRVMKRVRQIYKRIVQIDNLDICNIGDLTDTGPRDIVRCGCIHIFSASSSSNNPPTLYKHRPQIFRALCHAELALKTLTINMDTLREDVYLINSLLSFDYSLRCVKVIRAPTVNPYLTFPLALLPSRLTQLTLVGPIFDSMNFLCHLPQLAKLCMIGNGNLDPMRTVLEDNLAKYTFRNMREFEYNMSEPVQVEHIGLFIRWFENLTKLGLRFKAVTFQMVCGCKKWANLKHLMDYGDELDEEAITGYSFDSLERGHNITDLKYLVTFGTHTVNLTDLSVAEGLLKMKHLHTIKGLPDMMSDEARDAVHDAHINMEGLEGDGNIPAEMVAGDETDVEDY